MRAALIAHRVLPDVEANLSEILRWIEKAARSGADLIVFSEAALTGLINTDEPAVDLLLGQTIPGPLTETLAQQARRRHIWLALGLLEREGNRLYDSAVLLAPDGCIALKYRRIQPQWHGKRADPAVYCQGHELPAAQTPLGSFVFLICGDLFDDGLVQRVRHLGPDYLLIPFARCFDDGSYDQRRWDREERPVYVERVKLTDATALMVNYLADRELLGGAFGGAMVVSGNGVMIDCLPLGRPGMLVVDLQRGQEV